MPQDRDRGWPPEFGEGDFAAGPATRDGPDCYQRTSRGPERPMHVIRRDRRTVALPPSRPLRALGHDLMQRRDCRGTVKQSGKQRLPQDETEALPRGEVLDDSVPGAFTILQHPPTSPRQHELTL